MPAQLEIESLRIKRFKRFQDFTASFSRPVTIISGTNGTGKSTLLHLISNSFQRPTQEHGLTEEQSKILSGIGHLLNLKIGKLARGDKVKNDPTGGVRGTVYSATGSKFESIDFRRHQTKSEKHPRYSLKPYYASGDKTSLPTAAVAYLGLSRLLPQGEVDDNRSKTAQHALDAVATERFVTNYKRLTSLAVPGLNRAENLDGLKLRFEFNTEAVGIDSNTISAGQDNISVILSTLEHLAAFARSNPPAGGIVLIDEFDATLHPDLQINLLDLLYDFYREYGIQFVLTTQSMDVIECAFESPSKFGLVYLIRQGINRAVEFENPSPRNIRMLLMNKTVDQFDGYASRKLPLFSEDDEARFFIDRLFEFVKKLEPGFLPLLDDLQVARVKLGHLQLEQLFSSDETSGVFAGSVCVLDGDARIEDGSQAPEGPAAKDLSEPRGLAADRIAYLPGSERPEEVLYNYLRQMLQCDSPVLASPEWVRRGYATEHIERVLSDLDSELGSSSGGAPRKIYKKHFSNNRPLFGFVIEAWCRDPDNSDSLIEFLTQFGRACRIASPVSGVDFTSWHELLSEFKRTLGNLQVQK